MSLFADEQSRAAFLAKVAVGNPSECWEWQGARKPKGYGNVRISGRYMLSHRVAWELAFFPIPDGMVVCHACDNPACCNPAHLMLGRPQANFTDMMTKGRAKLRQNKAVGERNHNSKLDAEKVRAIRAAYQSREADQYQLADAYGVSQSAIGAIVRNETWRHV